MRAFDAFLKKSGKFQKKRYIYRTCEHYITAIVIKLFFIIVVLAGKMQKADFSGDSEPGGRLRRGIRRRRAV